MADDLRQKVASIFRDPKYGHDPEWLRINVLGAIAQHEEGLRAEVDALLAELPHAPVPGVDQDDPTHPDRRWCNVCGESADAPQHITPQGHEYEQVCKTHGGVWPCGEAGRG